MQKRILRRSTRLRPIRPSKVITSNRPPPPPPDDEEEELELELELDELLPDPGVGPEVTAAAQAVVPAAAGAWVVALLLPRITSALSTRPWSSVTTTRSVTEPVVGASTVAVLVLAPRMAGVADRSTMLQLKPATDGRSRRAAVALMRRSGPRRPKRAELAPR